MPHNACLAGTVEVRSTLLRAFGYPLLAMAFFLALPAPARAANIVIDHTNWNWYNSQPQAVIDAVAQQKIFFAHASVGGNILSGFSDLHGASATHYPLVQASEDATPPTTTSSGTIYEYGRGNPGWSSKVSLFETYAANGWCDPKVTIAMNKFCFIDQDATWTTYRDSMLALEAAHPDTTFVYWTMPLTTGSDSDAVLRAQFNQNLRNWIATQDNKVLFDIADIEAWNPSGVQQTFTYNSQTYPNMASEYTSDGGHLNQTGYDRVAVGLYSLFGQVAAATETPTVTPVVSATATPSVTSTGTVTPVVSATVTPTVTVSATATPSATVTATATISPVVSLTRTPAGPIFSKNVAAYPNPAKDRVSFVVRPGRATGIRIRLWNIAGEMVAELEGVSSGEVATVNWDCARVAPGVYFARVEMDGQTETVKLAIVK